MTATATARAPARSRRGARIGLWVVVGIAAIVGTFIAAWLVAAKNPSLSATGLSWQGEAFTEPDPNGSHGEDDAVWIAWDQPDGAWTSVVVTNDRPYAVTVSPGPQSPLVKVQVAAFDPNAAVIDIDGEHLQAVPQLRLPPGGYAVVSMHVSDRCSEMAAGSSTGSSVASLWVTTFGVTSNLDVPFPGTFLAGTTTGHPADPDCA